MIRYKGIESTPAAELDLSPHVVVQQRQLGMDLTLDAPLRLKSGKISGQSRRQPFCYPLWWVGRRTLPPTVADAIMEPRRFTNPKLDFTEP